MQEYRSCHSIRIILSSPPPRHDPLSEGRKSLPFTLQNYLCSIAGTVRVFQAKLIYDLFIPCSRFYKYVVNLSPFCIKIKFSDRNNESFIKNPGT